MTPIKLPKFVVLAILDGWGIAKESEGNAIEKANTPNMDKFSVQYPHTELSASGLSVGLPKGEDGNTETGHLNLGAGHIVYQDLERINMSIADGSFFSNKVLISAIEHAKKNDSKVHYMGLVGAGVTHSSIQHLYALIHLAKLENFKEVYIHLFTDGRDSPPKLANTYIVNILKVMEREKTGKIASVMGRYWAMDRDQRWSRTEKAYRALTQGDAHKVNSVYEAIENSYSIGVTDEFIEPAVIVDSDGEPLALIKDGDSIVFFNYRIDRPRQLSMAFVFSDFVNASKALLEEKSTLPEFIHKEEIKDENSPPFKRGDPLKNIQFITMTKFSDSLVKEGAIPAFPPEIVDMPIGKVISIADKSQLRVTESEKERFVTFYFNGLREAPFPREERLIIASPKVPTYDQKPEMSAEKLTNGLIKSIKNFNYQFILVNYPNADMIGHTGNLEKAIIGIETIDSEIGKLSNFILLNEGALMITADHGNAEEMINLQTGEIDTEHSTNPVPFVVIYKYFLGNPIKLNTGILADVAPTILTLLGVEIPSTMTGRNLLQDILH